MSKRRVRGAGQAHPARGFALGVTALALAAAPAAQGSAPPAADDATRGALVERLAELVAEH